MKRILYSSGSVVTSDKIADVLLEYARELARLETSATVRIPAAMDDGTVHEAQLLLGPASQLVSVDEESRASIDEAEESAVVERVKSSIAALRPKAAAVPDVDLSAADPYDD